MTRPLTRISPRAALILAGSVAALFAAPSAQAATYYWDGNDNIVGFGIATGVWAAPTLGTTTWGWSTSLAGVDVIAGNSVTSTTDDAINFGSGASGLGAGTVTVSGTVDAGSITFASSSGAITLSGGTINLADTSTITVDNGADTIGSVLAGAAASFTKAGAGALTLTRANTYTGTTIVNRGTLNLTGSLAAGNALTFSGTGVFNVAHVAGSSQAMGALSFSSGQGTVRSTYGGTGNSALTFSSLSRTAGAAGNLMVLGGTNGITNKIVVTGQSQGFIDKGVYFGGEDYAYYDAGGFVRAPVYGIDANFVTSAAGGGTTLGVNDAAQHVRVTQNISAQTTASINTLKILATAAASRTITISTGSTLTLNGILASGGTGFIRGATTDSTTTFISNGGSELTIRTAASSDVVSFANIGGSNERGLSYTGNGTTTISGPGYVNMRLIANQSTGQVTITGGSTVQINNGTAVAANTGSSLGSGNIRLDGGVIDGYFTGALLNAIGTGSNQIQIPGGVSGFGGAGWTINLGNHATAGSAASEIQWGGGAFNPSAFVLQSGSAGILSGDLAFTNRLDLSGETRTIFANGAGTSTATISGAIRTSTGTAGIIKSGAGTLILTNASNTYNGGITIQGGILSGTVPGSLGTDVSTNSVTVAPGGMLRLGVAAALGSNQAATLTSSPTALAGIGLGYNGAIGSNVTLDNVSGSVIGIGMVGYNASLASVLSGSNHFLGAALGTTNTFTGAAGTVAPGAGNTYRLGGGSGTLTFSTTGLFTGANNVQVGSTAVGSGFTIGLTAAQDYTGTTTVTTGNLSVSGAAGAIALSSSVTLNGGRLLLDNTGVTAIDRVGDSVAVGLSNGGELSLTAQTGATSAETVGALTMGAGRSIITLTAGAANTIARIDAASLSRTGFGTGLIRGTNLAQTSTTQVARLSLTTVPSGADFVGTNTVSNGGTGNNTQALRIIPWLIGSATATDAVGTNFVTYDTALGVRLLTSAQQTTLNATSTTAASPINAISFNGSITAATGIAVNSLLFSGAHTLNSSGASAPGLAINSGAVASLTANDAAIGGGWSSLILGNGEGIVTVGSRNLIIDTPVDVTSGGGLTKAGAGTLTLTAANLYTGVTRINGGTLQVGNGGTTGSIASTSSVVNDGALVFNRSNELGADFAISGAGTLTKLGAGVLTLTGTNTYSGLTSVNAGTLLVSGSLAGAVAVNNGSTLGSSTGATGGSVGSITVNDGGTLAPGASTGILTTGGNLTLNSGSTFKLEINGTGAGTGYDQQVVGGDVFLNGPVSLALAGTYTGVDDIFTIILNNGSHAVGGTAGMFAGYANDSILTLGAQQFRISYFDNASTPEFEMVGGNDVSLLAVPEPSVALTLLGGLGLLLGLRRRHPRRVWDRGIVDAAATRQDS
jgi:fibronectin-binding autotransporter adhesin